MKQFLIGISFLPFLFGFSFQSNTQTTDSLLLNEHQLNINTLYIFSSVIGGEPIHLVEFQYKRFFPDYALRSSAYFWVDNKKEGITNWINDTTTLNHIAGYKYTECGVTGGIEKRRALADQWNFLYGADLAVGFGRKTLFEEKYKYFVTSSSPDIPSKQYQLNNKYFIKKTFAGILPFVGLEYALSNRVSFIVEAQIRLYYAHSTNNLPSYLQTYQTPQNSLNLNWRPIIDRVAVTYYF